MSTIVWEPVAAHREELDLAISHAKRIQERLGARIGLWETRADGDTPAMVVYTAEFDDIAAHDDFLQRLRGDRDWFEFWTTVNDPTQAIARVVTRVLADEIDM